MTVKSNLPGPFALLGAIMRAWASTKKQLVEENIYLSEEDEKNFLSQSSRLEDSETLMMLGYVARTEVKTGRSGIMQANIVETLVPEPEQPNDAEKEQFKKDRQKTRQSIARRGASLSYFSLINRTELTKVAVEFSMTEDGKRAVTIFEEKFDEEMRNLEGGPDV